MLDLPDDVRDRIALDFPEDIKLVTSMLTDLESVRLARCALYLAKQDLNRLGSSADVAKADYRDLIWYAEYDHPDNRDVQLHDFNQPFGKSAID